MGWFLVEKLDVTAPGKKSGIAPGRDAVPGPDSRVEWPRREAAEEETECHGPHAEPGASSEEWLVMITWYTGPYCHCQHRLTLYKDDDCSEGGCRKRSPGNMSLSSLSLVVAALSVRPGLQFSPSENEIPDDSIVTLKK